MKKTFYLFCAFATTIVVSCSKTETAIDTPEPEMFEVKIGVSGAFMSEQTNLTKSGNTKALVGINVWSSPVDSDVYTNYAYGVYDCDEIVVSLLSGYKYKFDVRSTYDYDKVIDSDGVSTKTDSPFSKCIRGLSFVGEITNTFKYTSDEYVYPYAMGYMPIELYYGEIDNYVPSDDASISVDLVKMSYGLSVEAQNLSTGYMSVTVGEVYQTFPVTLTVESPSYYSIRAMRNLHRAYVGNSEEIPVSAELHTDDNVTIPIGSTTIRVSRNKLTKLKINANPPTKDNSFSFTYSSETIVDDDTNNFELGGEDVIDTPVTPDESQ